MKNNPFYPLIGKDSGMTVLKKVLLIALALPVTNVTAMSETERLAERAEKAGTAANKLARERQLAYEEDILRSERMASTREKENVRTSEAYGRAVAEREQTRKVDEELASTPEGREVLRKRRERQAISQESAREAKALRQKEEKETALFFKEAAEKEAAAKKEEMDQYKSLDQDIQKAVMQFHKDAKKATKVEDITAARVKYNDVIKTVERKMKAYLKSEELTSRLKGEIEIKKAVVIELEDKAIKRVTKKVNEE